MAASSRAATARSPRLGKTVVKHGVHDHRRDQPARRWWRPTARALYARNVLDFLKLVLDQGRRLQRRRRTTTSSPPA
ncbi:MAG: hypothetical protein MZW92_14635 [Comamonadaceae bacterium]|nr:hypothetical protein [Comamonadaceae bacterium]